MTGGSGEGGQTEVGAVARGGGIQSAGRGWVKVAGGVKGSSGEGYLLSTDARHSGVDVADEGSCDEVRISLGIHQGRGLQHTTSRVAAQTHNKVHCTRVLCRTAKETPLL